MEHLVGRAVGFEQLAYKKYFKAKTFGTIKNCEIHVFSDASMQCYGSCCLRLINTRNLGKARVAPIKSLSVPRLELTVAVVSVRIEQRLRQELKLEGYKTTFWTDATAIL